MLIADNLGPLGFDALTRDRRVILFNRLQLPITPGLARATTIGRENCWARAAGLRRISRASA